MAQALSSSAAASAMMTPGFSAGRAAASRASGAKKAMPKPPPSPKLHALFGFLTVTGLVGATALLVAALGDPGAASPQRHIRFAEDAALSPPAPTGPQHAPVGLKTRLSLDGEAGSAEIAGADLLAETLLDPAGLATVPEVEVEGGTPLPPPPDREQPRAWGSHETRGPVPLPKAPIAGLHKQGPEGLLPVIASDGRTPFNAYRRPFSATDPKPRIAMVLGGLGLNSELSRAAIRDLPPEITLSFVPYARDLQKWVDSARAAGHEVLIEIPLEPFDYPDNDTGPYTLLANADAAENQKRLEWILGRASGIFGAVNYQGAKFSSSAASVLALQKEIAKRGLAFIHNGGPQRQAFATEAERARTPFAAASRVVDDRPSKEGIDRNLLELEAVALDRGSAFGSAFAYPVTIEQLRSWTAGLASRGYALAPVSALVQRAPGQ